MDQYLKKNLSFISFLFIPIVFFWHPNWLGILGIQPYWPLFWLLPWSMIHGSLSGLVVGLFLGLTLDSISPAISFTQIPGLILCGLWFGRISPNSKKNVLVAHFRHGLICSIGSFLCSMIYFLQILIKNLPDNNFLLFYPSFKNVLAQIFLTGLFAPLICSQLLKLFKSSKKKNTK
tara:strand:- start:1460 stop:1987 length:528 start_codon:yes stop_codon:yes gene_type:complete